jgi:dynein light intermediate chain, axonemal
MEGGSQEVEVTPPDSLVKYEAPIFAGLEPSKDGLTAAKLKEGSTKLDEMVTAMLPPREWVEPSGVWMQHVSKEPATRLDVINLQEQLDKRLLERKARETGICPVREELYTQCLDELIREIALDGPERGLIMMRVRDEMRMTIDAYRTLYNSSVTFGIKKQLKAEHGLPDLVAKVDKDEAEKAAMEHELQELKSKLELIEKREAERKAADDKRRKEELDFLKYQGQHLDSFIKQMNGSK